MLKPMNLLPALLFPATALALLVGGIAFGTHPILSRSDNVDAPHRSSAAFNKTRLVVIRQQYKFYLRVRQRPEMAEQAASYYNQCVGDTDPSALKGTSLPHSL